MKSLLHREKKNAPLFTTSLPPSLSLSLSHTHTHSLSLSLSHTHTLSLSVYVYTYTLYKRERGWATTSRHCRLALHFFFKIKTIYCNRESGAAVACRHTAFSRLEVHVVLGPVLGTVPWYLFRFRNTLGTH